MILELSNGRIGPPRVKFCGMTRREDAIAAADLGADAIGFVFWPRSPRAVTPDVVREIVRALPRDIDKVGVFVNERVDVIADVVAHVGLTSVQLHGDESPLATAFEGVTTIKAVTGVGTDDVASVAGSWAETVTLLVDARDPERRGGTGKRADWAFASALACMRPMILAGGLSPETVIEAVHAVTPFAIDVSSGVEQSPGVKDRRRMQDLMAALRYGWGFVPMDADQRWRAWVQFRDAAPRGLGRARSAHPASEMMR
jgi:phosphoribosylanthranilate isomerase